MSTSLPSPTPGHQKSTISETPEIVLVEDNYTLWEGLLPQTGLSQSEADQVREMMLTRWYANADMYASQLLKRGFDAIRCVPSIRVREPTVLTHRLGHKVLMVPVGGRQSSGLVQALRFNRRLRTLFKRPPGVIHFNTYYSSYFAASPIWGDGTKLLAQYSGGEPPADGPLAEKLRFLIPVGEALRRSSGVLIGDFSLEEKRQKRILQRYYRVKNSQLHDFPVLAIDTTLFSERDKGLSRSLLGFNEGPVHVLVVSSIPRKLNTNPLTKNPFAVLRVFSNNDTKRLPWHLHFIGFGPGYGELVEEAHLLGVQEKVTFHKFVDHERLPFYYSACDVVINPYASLDLKVGTATMEGLACARPVLMFKRFSSLDFEQPGGFLIDPRPEKTEGELISILQDADRLLTKGKEGPLIASRFALPSVVERLVAIYRLVSEQRKTGRAP